jgi:hypothetical protein
LRPKALHIDRCPKCGKPGYLYIKFIKCGKLGCKCASGRLHGPYVMVRHYVGYIHEKDRRKVKACYISLKRLKKNEKKRIMDLLKKYES